MNEKEYLQKQHDNYYDFITSQKTTIVCQSNSFFQKILLSELQSWCEKDFVGNEVDLVGDGLLTTARMFIEQRHGFTSSKQTAKYLRNWADECEQEANIGYRYEAIVIEGIEEGIQEAVITNSSRYSCLCVYENRGNGKSVNCTFPPPSEAF